MYPSNAECKNHDYNKNLMDPPPLPSRIVCSTGDNECNVSWAVYSISFTNAITKRIYVSTNNKSYDLKLFFFKFKLYII